MSTAAAGRRDGRLSESAPAARESAASAATLSVGMAVALAAVFMAFGAVLLAYGIIRVQAPSWPPPGEANPGRLWPWPFLAAATGAALAGSAAMLRATRAGARSGRSLSRPLLLTAAAGVGFVIVQSLAWRWLLQSGVRPDSGLVASVIYALTIFHALHAAVALAVLCPLLARVWRARPVRPSSVAAVASFWHLVTVAWVVVLVTVFAT